MLDILLMLDSDPLGITLVMTRLARPRCGLCDPGSAPRGNAHSVLVLDCGQEIQ